MKALSAIFAVLLCIIGKVVPATAGEPTPDLKGVKTISYRGVADQSESRCSIDLKAWNTAIDFVANQSTKLKLSWNADWLLTLQYATFSSIVIQTSEQTLKSFINDWTQSQER